MTKNSMQPRHVAFSWREQHHRALHIVCRQQARPIEQGERLVGRAQGLCGALRRLGSLQEVIGRSDPAMGLSIAPLLPASPSLAPLPTLWPAKHPGSIAQPHMHARRVMAAHLPPLPPPPPPKPKPKPPPPPPLQPSLWCPPGSICAHCRPRGAAGNLRQPWRRLKAPVTSVSR